jgi:ribose transport system ATP-binding protein
LTLNLLFAVDLPRPLLLLSGLALLHHANNPRREVTLPIQPVPVSSDYALRMINIRKAFPGVVALDGVDLEVRRGEVHVLLGENGAGKSTLMKILSGAYVKDAGEIWIDGVRVDITGPRHARQLGVGVIYQELTLVPTLSAAENILLGREPRTRLGLVDRRVQRMRAQKILDDAGATFDARTLVSSLSLAERQMVEIARALSLDARILVMDEPTSALSERETHALFVSIRRLTTRGVAVVYISHRLAEIFEIGQRVTVLRDGRRVATHDVATADRRELVRLMADRDVDDQIPQRSIAPGDEMLRVERLRRHGVLHDVSFTVRSREIVCLAGLMGSGRTQVARAVFGADPTDAGEIHVRGIRRTIRSPRDAIRARIGLVPEDRKGQGLVLGLSVRKNITLPVLRLLSRLGVVRVAAERELGARFVRDLRVKVASADHAVIDLSGGNQQKVVLAKWLASRVDVLILDEPTRGIDVAAKQEVYQLINRLAAEGVGILLISSELPEVIGLADRIVVMREGHAVAELERGEATAERVMSYAVGT